MTRTHTHRLTHSHIQAHPHTHITNLHTHSYPQTIGGLHPTATPPPKVNSAHPLIYFPPLPRPMASSRRLPALRHAHLQPCLPAPPPGELGQVEPAGRPQEAGRYDQTPSTATEKGPVTVTTARTIASLY